MPDQFSYDEKCEELAKHFLFATCDLSGDTIEETEIKRLAQRIQDDIEDWLEINGYGSR